MMTRVEFVGGEYDGERMIIPWPFPELCRSASDDVVLALHHPDVPDPARTIHVLTYQKAGRRHPNGPMMYRLKNPAARHRR